MCYSTYNIIKSITIITTIGLNMLAIEFKVGRKHLKMSQGQLDERLGVSQSAISHMEAGRSKITKQTELLFRQLEKENKS